MLDSSAVVAVFLKEPGYEALVSKLETAERLVVGAPTWVETAIVLSHRFRRDARGLLARFADEMGVEVVPFTDVHFTLATSAWLRFGKRRHAANLNFGDCLTYAVASALDLPLLCAGDDFPHTDLRLA